MVMLHRKTVVKYICFRQALTEMQLTPQLVDAETQSCCTEGDALVLIEVVVVVESGRARHRRLLIQDRAPLG